jgi:hypothetical protein
MSASAGSRLVIQATGPWKERCFINSDELRIALVDQFFGGFVDLLAHVIHHIGYDKRRGIDADGKRMPSILDQLREVVNAVKISV